MLPLPGHEYRTRAVAYAPTGSSLASGGGDGAVRVWDVITGAERLCLQRRNWRVLGLAWSQDGSRILASDRGAGGRGRVTIAAWDARSGEQVGTFAEGVSDGRDVLHLILGTAPNPGGASQVRQAEAEAEAAAWRLSRAQCSCFPALLVLDGREPPMQGDVSRASFPLEGYDGFVVGRGNTRGHFYKILARQGPVEHRCHYGQTRNGTRSGDHVRGTGVNRVHSGDVAGAFSPDGRTLAVGVHEQLLFWDIDARRVVGRDCPGQPSRSLAFAPDGRTLAADGRGGKVSLWDVAEKRKLAEYDGAVGTIDAVAFSPDGSTVAAGGRQGIVVWDVAEDDWR